MASCRVIERQKEVFTWQIYTGSDSDEATLITHHEYEAKGTKKKRSKADKTKWVVSSH